jgi:hypothetical protein
LLKCSGTEGFCVKWADKHGVDVNGNTKLEPSKALALKQKAKTRATKFIVKVGVAVGLFGQMGNGNDKHISHQPPNTVHRPYVRHRQPYPTAAIPIYNASKEKAQQKTSPSKAIKSFQWLKCLQAKHFQFVSNYSTW